MQANERTDKRVAQYSTRLFLHHSAHRVTAAFRTETLAVMAALYCSTFSENDSCEVSRCSNTFFPFSVPGLWVLLVLLLLLLVLLLLLLFLLVEEAEEVISEEEAREEEERESDLEAASIN